MQKNSTNNLEKPHVFHEGNLIAERNTKLAVLFTIVMMIAEIAGGLWFNSMALLADGFHMSSHAVALGLSVIAYIAARRLANNRRFSFGTWKIEILGGYTSALFLVAVALLMLFHSIERLITPMPIHYDEAIILAIIGLVVNLICAWLLKDNHSHHNHDHTHAHPHDNHDDHINHDHSETPQKTQSKNKDLNLHAAYIHVLTDAATSVLAIIALLGGKFWGFGLLDPIMGIIGAIIITIWAYGLIKDTGKILLDAEMDAPIVKEIQKVIQNSSVKASITDLHVWRVSKDKYACIISLHTNTPDTYAEYFKQLLSAHKELVHITVEINQPHHFVNA